MRWAQLHGAAAKLANDRKKEARIMLNSSRACAPTVRAKQLTTLMMNWSRYTERLHCAATVTRLHALHASLSHDCAHDGFKIGTLKVPMKRGSFVLLTVQLLE